MATTEGYSSLPPKAPPVSACVMTACVSLSRGFVADALAAGFMRRFAFVDSLSPVYSADDAGGVHVLMPMRGSVPDEIEREIATQADARAARTKQGESGGETQATAGKAESPPEPATENENKNENNSGGENRKNTKGTHTAMPKTQASGKTDRTGMKTAGTETALDRALAAYENARSRMRELSSVLGDLSSELKAAVREHKAQAKDMEAARTALAKLQQISL